MAAIMCAQRLWQVVRGWEGQAVAGRAPLSAQGRLGRWAATRFQEGSDDLVLAISERGFLTVVIPLGSADDLVPAFTSAVGAALQDIGAPGVAIARELAGIRSVSLHYLHDAELRDSLNELKNFCGIELAYHTDLRRVQRNLNDLPRRLLRGELPSHYVARLFDDGGAGSTHVH
jgi:hypothetical protein